MKSHLFSLAVVAAFVFASPIAAQGTIDFSNIKSPGRPRVYDPQTGALAGPDWMVGLLVRNPATGSFEGVVRLRDVGFPPVPTELPYTGSPFLSGANAGLFTGGPVIVPFVRPGEAADILIRVWDTRTGTTFDQAWVKGEVVLSVGPLGGLGSPPSLPATLRNFTGIVTTPEPATLAYLVVGGAGIVALGRRTRR